MGGGTEEKGREGEGGREIGEISLHKCRPEQYVKLSLKTCKAANSYRAARAW